MLLVAYVAVDATGVPQQGLEGAKAESRMANVAVIYNPVPDDPACWANPATGREPPWQARYVASLERVAELGATVWQQGVQVGIERAERWVALSDGGSGLEEFLRTHFPRVDAVILDFYHAAEYLSDLAKAWQGTDAQAAEALGQQWCHQLKHAGGQALLATLRGARPAGAVGRRPRGVSGHGAVCGESRPSHGLPTLSRQGVADWERAGGGGVQAGGRAAAQRGGHALGGRGRRGCVSSPGVVLE